MPENKDEVKKSVKEAGLEVPASDKEFKEKIDNDFRYLLAVRNELAPQQGSPSQVATSAGSKSASKGINEPSLGKSTEERITTFMKQHGFTNDDVTAVLDATKKKPNAQAAMGYSITMGSLLSDIEKYIQAKKTEAGLSNFGAIERALPFPASIMQILNPSPAGQQQGMQQNPNLPGGGIAAETATWAKANTVAEQALQDIDAAPQPTPQPTPQPRPSPALQNVLRLVPTPGSSAPKPKPPGR